MLPRTTALGAASAAFVALALPAAATTTSQPAASGDWTGGYAGVELSYGDVEADDLFGDEDANGGLYGVNAGYRYDLGRFVLGGEVGYDATDITLPDDTDVNGVVRAGVTAGYDLGRILPYVAAGYAGASVENDGLDIDEDLDGGFYGIGVAYQATDRIAIGAEVIRHRFEVDFDGLDEDADLVTFGVKASYRF